MSSHWSKLFSCLEFYDHSIDQLFSLATIENQLLDCWSDAVVHSNALCLSKLAKTVQYWPPFAWVIAIMDVDRREHPNASPFPLHFHEVASKLVGIGRMIGVARSSGCALDCACVTSTITSFTTSAALSLPNQAANHRVHRHKCPTVCKWSIHQADSSPWITVTL